MKAIDGIIEFFNAFPSSEFDVESVTAALTGYGCSASVRRAIDALTTSGYLKWRWQEGRYRPTRMYSINLPTIANSSHDALA